MYGVFYVMRMFSRFTVLHFFRGFLGFSGNGNESEPKSESESDSESESESESENEASHPEGGQPKLPSRDKAPMSKNMTRRKGGVAMTGRHSRRSREHVTAPPDLHLKPYEAIVVPRG